MADLIARFRDIDTGSRADVRVTEFGTYLVLFYDHKGRHLDGSDEHHRTGFTAFPAAGWGADNVVREPVRPHSGGLS